jgi:hypothetical protein
MTDNNKTRRHRRVHNEVAYRAGQEAGDRIMDAIAAELAMIDDLVRRATERVSDAYGQVEGLRAGRRLRSLLLQGGQLKSVAEAMALLEMVCRETDR